MGGAAAAEGRGALAALRVGSAAAADPVLGPPMVQGPGAESSEAEADFGPARPRLNKEIRRLIKPSVATGAFDLDDLAEDGAAVLAASFALTRG
ncbi:hypothetical protein [Streptomyces sp. NPDC050416]|uniref:hypothetical protein n=1 Tax=Streptomyces sp. NPDC050416 TaxID=3365611 RepID=UPI0037A2127E